MNVTPAFPGFVFLAGLSTSSMVDAFDPNPWPSPQIRWMGPTLTQVGRTPYVTFQYALPQPTKVGDELELLLVDQTLFPTRVLKIVLDDYSIFLAHRRTQGVFIKNEINTNDWPALGITPGVYDIEVVHYGAAAPGVPTPPAPAPQQVVALPNRVVALSFLRPYTLS